MHEYISASFSLSLLFTHLFGISGNADAIQMVNDTHPEVVELRKEEEKAQKRQASVWSGRVNQEAKTHI